MIDVKSDLPIFEFYSFYEYLIYNFDHTPLRMKEKYCLK